MREPAWKRRIRELVDSGGVPAKTLSEQAGLNATYIRDLLQRDKEPGIEAIQKIARALGLTVAEFLDESDSRIVRVVGRLGAGAEIRPEYEQVPPEGLWEVELPFSVPDEMIAFEVEGDSMIPRYEDRDVVVCYREQRRPIEAFYGEEAAVRLADGRRFLKRIARGGRPGTVNLESFNARTIEGVRLEWIGEVWLTLRAGQVRRLDKTEALLRRQAAGAAS